MDELAAERSVDTFIEEGESVENTGRMSLQHSSSTKAQQLASESM